MSNQRSWALMHSIAGSLFVVPDSGTKQSSIGFTVVDMRGTEAHVFISPQLAHDLGVWLKTWAAEQGIQP